MITTPYALQAGSRELEPSKVWIVSTFKTYRKGSADDVAATVLHHYEQKTGNKMAYLRGDSLLLQAWER